MLVGMERVRRCYGVECQWNEGEKWCGKVWEGVGCVHVWGGRGQRWDDIAW